MTNLISFCLALILGIVAAGLNWVWVSSQARPAQYVGLKNTLLAGDTIDEKQLVAVPVPGDPMRLKKSLVPFADRAILFGLDAPRDYSAGDVVLQRDIQPPLEDSQWEAIGPFRLISVGEKFSRDDEYASRSSDNSVTIAVDANFDAKTRRLLEVINSVRATDDGTEAPKIAAVHVVPSSSPMSAKRTKLAGNVVYQTVSLDGIANVPRVLLEGSMILFVVPARPTY